jgi:acetyl esterase/lipase
MAGMTQLLTASSARAAIAGETRGFGPIPQFARIVPFFCQEGRSSCAAESVLTALFRTKPATSIERAMHKPILAIFLFVLVCANLPAEAAVWQPSPGHVEVPIWPGAVPDAMPNAKPESVGPGGGSFDVSRPTMTVYAANGRNTGVAVVVFPGGGYQAVVMGGEGTEICDWLTSRGITCVLLKYRVPDSGPTMKNGRTFYPKVQTAAQDAQRTLGLVRQHAAEWHVDPHKIGVIGFSAGGHLVAAVSTRFAQRTYQPVDAADELSCRPDFAIALYPGHLWTPGTNLTLRSDIHVRADTPPTFLLQAEDDNVDPVKHSLTYYFELQQAGVPAEMHLFAQGGHAFGLSPTKLPIGRWPELVEQWLHTIGVLGPQEN